MHLRDVIPLACLLFAGAATACAVDGLEAEEDVVEASLVVPRSIEWVPGTVTPEELHPDGVSPLFTLTTLGWEPRTFMVWGVSGGQVQWVYRVSEVDRPEILDTLAQGADMPRLRAAGRGQTSITINKPPRRPGGGDPPGDEFSAAYVSHILDVARNHQAEYDVAWEEL